MNNFARSIRNLLLWFAVIAAASGAIPARPAGNGQAWIDSLKKIVRRGLPANSLEYSNYRRAELKKIAYLQACGLLGDYYAALYKHGKLPDLKKAMQYYDRVIYLSSGTDSDLGDDNSLFVRNRICRRVAALYNSGKLDMRLQTSLYVGFYLDVRDMNIHRSFDGGFSDSGKAVIGFVFGNAGISLDAQLMLKNLAVIIKEDMAGRIVISGGECGSSFQQQLSWDRANATIEFFVSNLTIERSKFIMSYCGPGNIDEVTIRFALPGEEGPSALPPPHPNLHALHQ